MFYDNAVLCIFSYFPVPAGSLLLPSGLCPLAHGGLCGARASAGDGLRLVCNRHGNNIADSPALNRKHLSLIIIVVIDAAADLLPSSTSMQSIQNLGLALIAMAAGAILDNKGYLVLEVFFCGCICCQYFFVLFLRGPPFQLLFTHL